MRLRKAENAVDLESGDQSPDWTGAALAEYDAHRAEVLAEAQGQHQTLALGGTAVGILVAGAFNVWDDALLATIAFLGAIPLLCMLVLIQVAGRAYGMMLVGVYLEGLERALRGAYALAPGPVLSWEETLVVMRTKHWWSLRYGWSDLGAVGVFAVFAAGSIALGAYRGYAGHERLVVVLTAIQISAPGAVHDGSRVEPRHGAQARAQGLSGAARRDGCRRLSGEPGAPASPHRGRRRRVKQHRIVVP